MVNESCPPSRRPARPSSGRSCLTFALLAAGAFLCARPVAQVFGQASPRATIVPPSSATGGAAAPDAGEEVECKHPEQFKLAHVTIKELDTRVRTSGSVTWDVNRAVPIYSIAGGRAIEVRAKLGDEVKKDQVLVVVDSPDMAGAAADYLKAVSSLSLARKSQARTKYMFDHDAAPLKDLQQTEEDLGRAQVDVQAAAEHIRLMGGKAGQKTPRIEVRSPIAGTIVEQNVVKGAAIRSLDNSVNLFTVADLSKVWVISDLYESNLADVSVGASAQVTFTAFPEKKITGTVGRISKVLDPATRAAKVRVELDNPDGTLRPGMFARVKFMSVKTVPNTIVPTSAILDLHDRSWVFLHETGNRFRRTEVQTGITLKEGFVEVHGGLRPGDEVVQEALLFSAALADEEQK